MKVKTERLASMLLKELNDVIYNTLRDEDIKNTTATYVKLSDDLCYAKIYCTNFNTDKVDKAVRDLNSAKGFIKSELYKRKLPMRTIPEMEFVRDDSIDYGMKIEKIIEKINKDE